MEEENPGPPGRRNGWWVPMLVGAAVAMVGWFGNAVYQQALGRGGTTADLATRVAVLETQVRISQDQSARLSRVEAELFAAREVLARIERKIERAEERGKRGTGGP